MPFEEVQATSLLITDPPVLFCNKPLATIPESVPFVSLDISLSKWIISNSAHLEDFPFLLSFKALPEWDYSFIVVPSGFCQIPWRINYTSSLNSLFHEIIHVDWKGGVNVEQVSVTGIWALVHEITRTFRNCLNPSSAGWWNGYHFYLMEYYWAHPALKSGRLEHLVLDGHYKSQDLLNDSL